MEREKLKSRLGFILLSAGCAIGIGNVWKFPYMAGQGGGGAFVLFYLLFLVILGLPIMTMEFAVGRASHKSPVRAYQALEKPGQKWHIHGYFTLIGCYLLMMFYTTVAGWMLHYFYMTAAGKLVGLDADQVAGKFTEMLASPLTMGFWMVVVVAIGIFVCARGLQNGLEKVTKVMMIALLVIIWALIVLPKRERQVNRQKLIDDGQHDMFGQEAPLPHGEEVAGSLSEASLLADFAPVLGHKTYVQGKLLSRLAQLGFIERRGGLIFEGPLLDVLLDYRLLADRIIYGTLGEVLAQAGHPPPASDAFTPPEDTAEDD